MRKCEEERIFRVTQIKNLLEDAFKQGKRCDKEKVIAFFCCRMGTARRTVLEYIDLLVKSGQVREVEEGDLRILASPDKSNKEEQYTL